MANPNGWNYNSGGAAPEFMEFGSPRRSNVRPGFRPGSFDRGRSDWRFSGPSGGGSRPRFPSYGPPQPYYHQRPPNRGFQELSQGGQLESFTMQPRGSNFNRPYRGRGGRGAHGNDNQESDISVYFHPSMLENPWPSWSAESPKSSGNNHPPVVPRTVAPPIHIAPDDEELQAILQEIKQKKDTDQTPDTVEMSSSAVVASSEVKTRMEPEPVLPSPDLKPKPDIPVTTTTLVTEAVEPVTAENTG